MLIAAAQGTAAMALSGCEKIFDGLSQNKAVQSVLESAEGLNRRVQRMLTIRNKLAREFTEKDISPKFRANGNPPPITMDYAAGAQNNWANWRLEVAGLVQKPAQMTLDEIKAMPARTQITRHDCVEGWSAIGKWKGVRLEDILKRVRPRQEAKYIVFRCMDTDGDGNNYYESIDLIDAVHPQTILAYELNDQPLPIDNGAPLRLRVENQLGYKMVKWIERIEFVRSEKELGKGEGGKNEDDEYFDLLPNI